MSDHLPDLSKVNRLNITQRDIHEVGIVTVPGLADEITHRARTCMVRHEWPLYVQYHDERLVDAQDMRRGYQPLHTLLATELAAAGAEQQELFVMRFNIPMNLSTGWHQNGHWNVFEEDIGPEKVIASTGQLQVPYMIVLNHATNQLYVRNNSYELQAHESAIVTAILGFQGRFQKEVFLQTTHDPRHIINLNYDRPTEHHDKTRRLTAADFLRFNDTPNNRFLLSLARAFLARDSHYVEQADAAIAKYGWSKYDRTVLVLSEQDAGDLEVYKFYNTEPPRIAEFVWQTTRLDNPIIFGLTEGGSYATGCFRKNIGAEIGCDVVEFGSNRDYFRGAEGLFAVYLKVTSGLYNRITTINSQAAEILTTPHAAPSIPPVLFHGPQNSPAATGAGAAAPATMPSIDPTASEPRSKQQKASIEMRH
jgi:hypothetical protein